MKTNSILFLTYWYPNKNNLSNGIFVKRHAHAASVDNNIILLSLNISKHNSFYGKRINVFDDENELETHQITIESKFYKLFYVLLPLQFLILRNYIKKNILVSKKIAIIHSNVIYPCGIVGFFLSKHFKCKHVLTEHWTKLDKFFKISIYSYLGRKVYNNSSGLTCVSEQLKETIQKHSRVEKVEIIPNVISENEFHVKTGVKKNEILTFVAVANWAGFKNPFYFLEALQELSEEKKINEFKIILVGEGVQLAKIKQNGYNFRIEFPGYLSANEICVLFNKSHVFLHGSDFETFSVVIAEALACGLPCVVSPVGIAKKVINSSNGFITNNTHEDWKEKISKCLATIFEPKLISNTINGRYNQRAVSSLLNNFYNHLDTGVTSPKNWTV